MRNGDGVNLDFEEIHATEKPAFTKFIVHFAQSLRSADPQFTVILCLYAIDWSTVFDIQAIDMNQATSLLFEQSSLPDTEKPIY
ncbi:MAG: hypothetical protein R2794_06585 [Chitinophagales bacterium]